MKKKGLFIAVLITLAVMVSASDLTGSKIAETGTISVVNGTLKNMDGELFLENDDGLYQLHLGPEWYAEKIGFQRTEGALAAVEGCFADNDIAPMIILVDEEKYIFRNTDGIPMWSGNKNNENRGRYHLENGESRNNVTNPTHADNCDDSH